MKATPTSRIPIQDYTARLDSRYEDDGTPHTVRIDPILRYQQYSILNQIHDSFPERASYGAFYNQ